MLFWGVWAVFAVWSLCEGFDSKSGRTVGGKKDTDQWVIPVHAPARHATRIPRGGMRAGGWPFFTTPLYEENAMTSPSLRAAAKKKSAHALPIFLKNIMQSLPQYLFWKDTGSIYLGCNQNYAELVGLHSVDEIVGKTDDELHWQCGGHTENIFQKGDQDTLQGHPIINQEETLVLPNGRKMMTLVSKLPMQDARHKIIGFVCYFTDITPLKEKKKELRKAKQQADAANQSKSAFMMSITHDIRTPLTGILEIAKL